MITSWRRLGKFRKAAMAVTAKACSQYALNNKQVNEAYLILKDDIKGEAQWSSNDRSQLKSKYEAERYRTAGHDDEIKPSELIWDTIAKSGFSLGTQVTLARCFEAVIGEQIVPEVISKDFPKADQFWDTSLVPYVGLVPITRIGGHNYPVGRLFVVCRDATRNSNLKMNGRLGNFISERYQNNLAMPSIENMTPFFSTKGYQENYRYSSEKSGINIGTLRDFYYGSKVDYYYENISAANDAIEEWAKVCCIVDCIAGIDVS